MGHVVAQGGLRYAALQVHKGSRSTADCEGLALSKCQRTVDLM